MKKSLGIYIHVPFCIKKCGYCDFCSFASKNGNEMRLYSDELCRRIQSWHSDGYTVDTVYMGGGTPSLLDASDTEKILRSVCDSFDVAPDAEITLECNPATADRTKLSALRAMGINRLSIGLQSAVDSELSLLGRAHSFTDFVSCFEDARKAGFDNISADLMYGIPDQTLSTMEHSVRALCELSPEHISAYGLSIEEGTDFYRRRGSLHIADDDGQAAMYLRLSELLLENGYKKYEISNFSRSHKESRHNLRYWLGKEYIGFGVAAHSYIDGARFGNSRDMAAFLDHKDITAERTQLTSEEKRLEYIMLRLRLTHGIDTNEYKALFGNSIIDDAPCIDEFLARGFMNNDNGRIYFTDKGFLVSNILISEMI